jgi:hypothetical protein
MQEEGVQRQGMPVIFFKVYGLGAAAPQKL